MTKKKPTLPKGFNTADPDKPGPAPKQPKKRKPAKRTNKQQPWTQERMERYCEEFRKHGRPGVAARAVWASKRNVVRKRETCQKFDEMVSDAWEDFMEQTIAHVQEFAWKGKQEPIIHQGEVVGVRTVYFTKMMELEAKRVVPGYRDSSKVEISGGLTIDDQLAALEEELEDGIKGAV